MLIFFRSSVAQFLLANGSSQSWLVGNTLVTVTTSDSPLNECAVCKRRKARHDASKAAAKLRLFNTNIDSMLETRSTLPLPQAVEAGDSKAGESCVSRALPGSLREPCSSAGSSPVEKEFVKPAQKDWTDDPNSDLTPYHCVQPLVVCDIPESQAVENPVQWKDSRVDSAMEVTEDTESYRISENTRDVNGTSERAENNQQNLRAAESVVETSKKEGEKVFVASLVDRLALEQQDAGHAFSPTHYFLNEMTSVVESGTQADSSMEVKEGKHKISLIFNILCSYFELAAEESIGNLCTIIYR